MINMRRARFMKKLSLTLTILLMLLSNCSKKPVVVTGVVGNPINLVPEIKKSEDTTGCTFKWGFIAKPAESIMDVLSFIPDSRSSIAVSGYEPIIPNGTGA